MGSKKLPRKLAVILHADVVESTELVRLNESIAHDRMRSAFRSFSKVISAHGGRTREIRGDALVAELPMASDAVAASVEFQAANLESNCQLDDSIRPVLRIGIAIGEVVVADDTITGEGVVLAQRLEQLAAPGGVCIQGAACETVPKRMPFEFDNIGEVSLKGFPQPVRVFQVKITNVGDQPLNEAAAPPVADARQLEKPSIAVLPFTNLSGDIDQEYFADGISEDIITGLSRFHLFFVIAKNSSFAFRKSGLELAQIAQKLGARYLLEGSVRRAGNRVRISARLVDADSAHHVWGEKYDRNLEDIFQIQDEISEAIIAAIGPAFVSAEAKRTQRKTRKSFDSWDYAMRGSWHLSRQSKKDLLEAKQLFEQALELDANNGTALSGLAFTLCWMNIFAWQENTEAGRQRASDLAKQAIAIDDGDAFAHAVLGWVRFTQRNLDDSVAACTRALELNPNLALAHSIISICSSWHGLNDKALMYAEIAERLSPRDPAQSMWSFARASAEFGCGNYEQAAERARLATNVLPEFPGAWRYLASSLAHLNRMEEAGKANQTLLGFFPGDNIRLVHEGLPSVDQDRMDRFVSGLKKAGLPEA